MGERMNKSIMTLVLTLGFSPCGFAGERSAAPAAVVNSRMPMQTPSPTPARSTYNGITFGQYVAENAGNPALSRRIAGHQTAFIDFSKTAVISMPEEFMDSPPSDNNRMPASVPSAAPVGNAPAAGFPAVTPPTPPDPFGSPSSSGPAR